MIGARDSQSATPLPDAQRLDWLRLIRSESVGPKTFRVLLRRFGSAGAALEALPGLAAERGRTLKIPTRADCEREIDSVRAFDARLIALGEPGYPPALGMIDAPPPLICARGRVDALKRPMVAIVGSRNASAAGLAFCERLTRDLGAAGFVVVSGLARGIDARAHRTAVSTGTIAALAGGLDRLYPAEHAALAEEILEHGAWVSEMPMGWEPRGRDFPRRNRLVSGMALGLVVVEAARRSGSLISARFANEQGREVFAVPGSPLDPRAEGANGLLREGATLCTRAADVIDALSPLIERGTEAQWLKEDGPGDATQSLWDEMEFVDEGRAPLSEYVDETEEPPSAPAVVAVARARPPSDPRRTIERLLGPTPTAIDDLARAANLPISEVRIVLLDLELEGRLERHGSSLVSYAPRP